MQRCGWQCWQPMQLRCSTKLAYLAVKMAAAEILKMKFFKFARRSANVQERRQDSVTPLPSCPAYKPSL